MANTTNFNWETPDDTDLVKDGAAAIRTLGSAIDTSLVDLKGGTTGQILAKNTNTDMDFVWVANDVGDITAVNVSSPITGGGTTGAVTISIQDATTAQKGAVQLENSTSSTSTTTAAVPASVKSAYDLADGAIAKTLIDAKGDLIVGSAADTAARLAVGGTNGHVLTVNSGATNGIEWAAAAGGATYAVFQNKLAAGNLEGSFTSGAFRTRALNTSQYNGITGASLASNQITLAAGTYFIEATTTAYAVNYNVARFYNITDSTTTLLGSSAYADSGSAGTEGSSVYGVFTIAAQKTFELQHACSTTRNTDGFGVGLNNLQSVDVIFSQVRIAKIG